MPKEHRPPSRDAFRRVAIAWIVLTLVSTGVRYVDAPPGPKHGQNVAAVPLFDDVFPAENATVDLACWDSGSQADWGSGSQADSSVIVLLHGSPAGFLIQEFVPGEEFGLFYVRHPSKSSGMLFSVTEKVLVEVRGNGDHTLERLILDDDRAVCMAPTFLKRHTTRLDSVPEKGEQVRLVNVGTHARGALFLDATSLITPELEEAVDAFASRMPGFHFGRFDIRVPSRDHLRRGEGIKVLEVNGVSSEATHIYDPNASRRDAIRTLGEQWRLAFEIGRANMELGDVPTSLGRLLQLIWTWKVRPAFRPDTRAAAEWSVHSGGMRSPDSRAE